jgi:aspartyl-tRNA(Asn)/glutamyl-tRNA(Gln) amidotransferase subunit C
MQKKSTTTSDNKNKKITATQVKNIANLAHIPVTDQESTKLATAFAETLDVIENLKSLNVQKTPITYQVTGLENVLREDVVNEENMFTQEQALANAPKTHQGYFVVPRLIDNES